MNRMNQKPRPLANQSAGKHRGVTAAAVAANRAAKARAVKRLDGMLLARNSLGVMPHDKINPAAMPRDKNSLAAKVRGRSSLAANIRVRNSPVASPLAPNNRGVNLRALPLLRAQHPKCRWPRQASGSLRRQKHSCAR